MSERPAIYERRLTARFLFREAARTLRERFWRVVAVAFVVALGAAVLDGLFDQYLAHVEGDVPGLLAAALVGVAIVVTGVNSFGSTFLAGVLDKTVGEHQHGHKAMGLGQLFLAIPYLTLIGADVLVSLLRAAGWVLLFVPGMIAMTVTAIVGPVVMVEGRGAFSAIRRSAQLTWPAFWLVFRAVTIPVMAEGVFDEAITSLPFVHGFLLHGIATVFVEMPVAAFLALVEVTLAYHLIERNRPGSISAHT